MRHLIAVNPDGCTGCKTCELVCSLFHSGQCNPARAAIRVVRREKDGLVFSLPLVCQQCKQAPCIAACPADALSRGQGQDTLTIDQERCTACGECTDACPAGCIFIDNETKVALCCDLCRGQPQCVAFCHAHCLTFVAYDPANEEHTVERLARMVAEQSLMATAPGEGGER